MTNRIVVRIEWRPEIDPDVEREERDSQWLDMLKPLFERAGALGGRVIGWGGRELVVDFAWDGLYDAVDFLVDAPLAPELASGLCHGESETVFDGGRVALVLGSSVQLASVLTELARPGEVLVSPALVEEAEGRIGTLGEVGSRKGRPDVPALILDPEAPLRETKIPSPPASEAGFELVSTVKRSRPPSSRAPESETIRQVEKFVHATDALGDEDADVFPKELSSTLRKRDAASLHELAQSVRENHASDAADRLDAIAKLADGKSGEALRKLRRSKEKAPVGDPSARCRAALALAVALASAGRPYEAALEGLDGVARAREGHDERGERACARFLSQLCQTFGDSDSSAAWGSLGE